MFIHRTRISVRSDSVRSDSAAGDESPSCMPCMHTLVIVLFCLLSLYSALPDTHGLEKLAPAFIVTNLSALLNEVCLEISVVIDVPAKGHSIDIPGGWGEE